VAERDPGPVHRAVVTVAGRGTRMLPATRGLRKELLPLFYRGGDGAPALAPVVHLVVQSLASAGVRDFTLVLGPDGPQIRRYFSRTPPSIRDGPPGDGPGTKEVQRLFDSLSTLTFHWAQQPVPRGFGDAVLRAERSLRGNPFLLHAADAILWEPRPGRLPRLMEEVRVREGASVVLLVRRVRDPRRYGVVQASRGLRRDGQRILLVGDMVEKPSRPVSPWAATALYACGPELLGALRRERSPGGTRELEVTDGIRRILREGGKVLAIPLRPEDGQWLSVGSPEGYLRALRRTYYWSRRPPS
jgi:UTP--glucose-1-phosphate uridylyltransferase